MYLHLYYNTEKQVNDANSFKRRMLQYREEILFEHCWIPEGERGYSRIQVSRGK